MRRDAYIQNDSGGFSVVSGTAVDAIIEDGRNDDEQFVRNRHALLLQLVGDDALPVRIVVDEPLLEDEEREWLARIRWQLDVPDGRVLVMGGFDPDVLQWWRDDHGPDADSTAVAVESVTPGRWDLDVYTYVNSLNGNALLREASATPGAWFRGDHPNTPIPLWLAHTLDYSGEEDPGHEDDWRNTKAAVAAGNLAIETETRGFVGMLFHLHKRGADAQYDAEPEGGWFDPDAGARKLERCPLGIVAFVEDPNLVAFAQRITGTEPPPREVPFLKGERAEIAASSTPIVPLRDGPVRLPVSKAWYLWAVASIGSEGTPAVVVHVANAPQWQPPDNEWLLVERVCERDRDRVAREFFRLGRVVSHGRVEPRAEWCAGWRNHRTDDRPSGDRRGHAGRRSAARIGQDDRR